jgi:hypothetical protein
VFAHLEPLNDPASWDDTSLDRRETLPLESQAENPKQSSDKDNPLPKNEDL